MTNKTMNIAFCIDENYISQVFVTINSILKNSKLKQPVIHFLMSNNMRLGDFERKLNEFFPIKLFNYSVHAIDNSIFVNAKTDPHMSHATYYKFLIPDLVDEDKVLYLDSDVLILSSLDDLFEIDLNDVFLAASKDYWVGDGVRKIISLNSESPYFNAGVMLLNCTEIRRNGLTSKLIEYANSSNAYTFHDQCIWNKFCENKIYLLNNSYNFMSQNFNSDRKLEINQVKIIHFNGYFGKPWDYFCFHPMRNLYHDYTKGNMKKINIHGFLNIYRKIRHCMKHSFGRLDVK